MVALEAVAAGEIALKRRENRDVQFRTVALDPREVAVERDSIVRHGRDEKPVLEKRLDRVTLVGPYGPQPAPISSWSSSAATSDDTSSCASRGCSSGTPHRGQEARPER